MGKWKQEFKELIANVLDDIDGQENGVEGIMKDYDFQIQDLAHMRYPAREAHEIRADFKREIRSTIWKKIKEKKKVIV